MGENENLGCKYSPSIERSRDRGRNKHGDDGDGRDSGARQRGWAVAEMSLSAVGLSF